MDFNEFKRKLRAFDYVLFILVCSLSIFGIIVIGSAKHINTEGYALEYSKQQLWFVTGIIMLIIVSFIDYKFISKFYIVAYVVNIVLLVLVIQIGHSTNLGATRQLGIGGASIQPSEFAKIFMIVYLSKFIDKFNDKINNIFMLMFIILSVIIPFILVMKQPSLSASLVIVVIATVMIFVGGISYKYIAAVFAVGIPSAIIVIQDLLRPDHIFIDKILKPYQIEHRILPFLNPELGSKDILYQTGQSVKAIASGQLNGQGLYNGTLNSLNYLPASHNDFIFAVIGEEFGYIGCMAVLFVILLIVIKCIAIAYKADTLTGRLIAAGTAFMFTFQTFVNIGVATNLLPNTGMALPFVSYGGSAMWVNMLCVGLVINVGMVKPKSLFEECVYERGAYGP